MGCAEGDVVGRRVGNLVVGLNVVGANVGTGTGACVHMGRLRRHCMDPQDVGSGHAVVPRTLHTVSERMAQMPLFATSVLVSFVLYAVKVESAESRLKPGLSVPDNIGLLCSAKVVSVVR